MDKTNIDNLDPELKYQETRKIGIAGMTCDSCVRTIETLLSEEKGIKKMRVDRHRGIVTVTFDTRLTNIPAIHDFLLGHGYHPTPFAEPVY